MANTAGTYPKGSVFSINGTILGISNGSSVTMTNSSFPIITSGVTGTFTWLDSVEEYKASVKDTALKAPLEDMALLINHSDDLIREIANLRLKAGI
jgi:hypothetical protein